MARDQIAYVATDDGRDPFHRIRYVGGINADGSRWTLSAGEAIDGIVAGLWTFYLVDGAGERVRVEVGIAPDDNLYLRTEVDAGEPWTLLRLPRCVPRARPLRAGGRQLYRPPVAA